MISIFTLGFLLGVVCTLYGVFLAGAQFPRQRDRDYARALVDQAIVEGAFDPFDPEASMQAYERMAIGIDRETWRGTLKEKQQEQLLGR
ncbi:MAG: hypothetical protein BRC58_07500 [Cyanobacteria bacterium QS_8_64_29]|nr:MAG: hypothetical protein BRC58_07500 [Cyanobacteria bacterium QS_8_64_29]